MDESEMDEKPDVAKPDVARVELRLVGDHVVPVELTAATKLSPSRAWNKGDPYESKASGKPTRPFGMWVITATGTKVEPCALDLLARAEPHAEIIGKLAREAGATVSVGIWWEPAGGQGGFTVSADVFRRLTALCDRVDVYFPG